MNWLLNPTKLWTWPELATDSANPPRSAGVYGWYFDALPPSVPTNGCHHLGNGVLAYVGIAPKAPSKDAPVSKQTLRKRIKNHFRGTAEGSTLRLTLGCLLATELDLELRRVGSGSARTFHSGEAKLSAWMAAHARVVFLATPEPWVLEEQLIETLSLPLNILGNKRHPFHSALSALRSQHRRKAVELDVVR